MAEFTDSLTVVQGDPVRAMHYNRFARNLDYVRDALDTMGDPVPAVGN